MPKLTLSAEQDVIDQAKRIAEARGSSVSAMFSGFVASVSSGGDSSPAKLGPVTRRALGLVKLPAGVSDRRLIEEARGARYGRR